MFPFTVDRKMSPVLTVVLIIFQARQAKYVMSVILLPLVLMRLESSALLHKSDNFYPSSHLVHAKQLFPSVEMKGQNISIDVFGIAISRFSLGLHFFPFFFAYYKQVHSIALYFSHEKPISTFFISPLPFSSVVNFSLQKILFSPRLIGYFYGHL